MGVASLVLGILSILICWIPCVNYLAFVPAVIGVILGIVDTVKKSKSGEKKGMAIAGLILSAVAVVIIFLWTVIFGAAVSTVDGNELNSVFENISRSINESYTTYNY